MSTGLTDFVLFMTLSPEGRMRVLAKLLGPEVFAEMRPSIEKTFGGACDDLIEKSLRAEMRSYIEKTFGGACDDLIEKSLRGDFDAEKTRGK